jgi:hypothetical protein
MTEEEKQKLQQVTFKDRFRPTASRLKEVTERGAELLANMDEEELCEFVEYDVKDDESDGQ